jgi:hypothetical protein
MSGGLSFAYRLVGEAGSDVIREPGFSQYILVSRQVFGASIRAKNIFEIRDMQREIHCIWRSRPSRQGLGRQCIAARRNRPAIAYQFAYLGKTLLPCSRPAVRRVVH